jgi:hypothetical protein
MIIEGIFAWFMQVLSNAISLLPVNGAMFASVKSVSFNIFGFMTLMDGYIPIKEFISVSIIVMGVSLAMGTIRITFGVFQMVMKVKP